MVVVTNWQLYRGSGRTRSAARRDAVRRALRCSVQPPDTAVTSDAATNHTDFTADSHDRPVSESEDAVGGTSWFLESAGSRQSTQRPIQTPSLSATSSLVASSRRRAWFNAAAVLHDVRPSASYTRQTSPGNGDIHATVTVDGQRFQGFGDTWRTAKRSAAAQALRHILQLRHLTSHL